MVTVDRWTSLDRGIKSLADEFGLLDIRPEHPGPEDPFVRCQMIRRLQYLETMGLAVTDGGGEWVEAIEAEPRLRDLGLRGDIIKTMHRALTDRGLERAFDDFVINAPDKSPPIVGRRIETGLRDELSEEAHAVIDMVDGRAHHIRFKEVDAFDHAPLMAGLSNCVALDKAATQTHACDGEPIRSRHYPPGNGAGGDLAGSSTG